VLNKDDVLKAIDDLPAQFSFETLLNRVTLLIKIDIGVQQSAGGETLSTNEAKEILGKWNN
jgi:hypothetical protein